MEDQNREDILQEATQLDNGSQYKDPTRKETRERSVQSLDALGYASGAPNTDPKRTQDPTRSLWLRDKRHAISKHQTFPAQAASKKEEKIKNKMLRPVA